MNNRLKKITLISVFTSLLCIISPISLYIGTIPISFSLLIILIINSIFNKFEGVFIILLYILIGVIGLPVFAGGIGGIQILLGPTGGFIIGYFVCSIVVSLLTNLNNKSNVLLIISYILGIIICYLLGLIHYIYIMNTTIEETLLICVYPFLIVDLVKIVVAYIISIILKNKLI